MSEAIDHSGASETLTKLKTKAKTNLVDTQNFTNI
ncbi:unnamed protein product [Linum tenue]|uniref:Uncharacterized protein n=1 Tax=Linum tenue TaxID=586396 RepID=A0AAV0NL67_9ROSI|nr:unnamed protein product [Linum tenue]